jgi:hypothetical protein
MMLKLGVFVLLGAIVNVAVAWGFILVGDRPRILTGESSRALTETELSQLFTRYRRPEWHGHINDWGVNLIAFDFTSLDSAGLLDPPVGNTIHYLLFESRHGVPYRSLRCATRFGLGPEGAGSTPAENLHSIHFAARYLPTSILWPGFAINMIFYAAMLWLLWIAPGKIRRFIIVRGRIRGHRCLACGYQIDSAPGIGPVCSECGAELPASWSTKSP